MSDSAPGLAPVAVTFVLPSAELGGSELYLLALLDQLGPEWVDQLVLLADGPARERFAELGLPMAVIPVGGRSGVLRGILRLRRHLARSEPPAVIHANGVKAALLAVLALRGSGVPVVWVKHDFSWDGLLSRWVAARCRVVVGVSSAVLASVVDAAPEVLVVPNGLAPVTFDLAGARSLLLAAADAEPEDELLVQVGRLETGKGQMDLVELLPRLREQRPRARIVFVGPASRFEPDYEQRLLARARELGVAASVTLLGYRSDAPALIAGADVVVVPTHPYTKPGSGEGFGLVAAEAMALGTPVVAYAVGGLPEVIGDAGVLIDPLDTGALGASLAEILADGQLRERLVAAGRVRAQIFDWAKTAEAMRQLYVRVETAP
jgi:glycosyltransferase involved in cell wall biosynthesis